MPPSLACWNKEIPLGVMHSWTFAHTPVSKWDGHLLKRYLHPLRQGAIKANIRQPFSVSKKDSVPTTFIMGGIVNRFFVLAGQKMWLITIEWQIILIRLLLTYIQHKQRVTCLFVNFQDALNRKPGQLLPLASVDCAKPSPAKLSTTDF